MELRLRNSLVALTILVLGCGLSAQAQTPTFTSATVVNASSQAGGVIAPGMVTVINGSYLSDTNIFRNCQLSNGSLPTSCNNTTVLVNGKAAPIVYAESDSTNKSQVEFQVPFGITGTSATLQVTHLVGGTLLQSSVVNINVAPTAPGLQSANGLGTGTAYYYAPSGYSGPVHVGDTVVLYGTGFGVTNPVVADGAPGPTTLAPAVASVTLTIGTLTVTTQYAGLEPGNNAVGSVPGNDEVIFTVPAGLAPPAGQTEKDYPIMVTVGGQASQSLQLRVGQPPVEISLVESGSAYGIENGQLISGFAGQVITSVESGSWISIFGANLSATTRDWTADISPTSNQLPLSLDGVSVTINNKPAAVYYISPTQINVQAPTDTAAGLVSVIVTNGYGSDQNLANLQQYAPAFFPMPQAGGISSTASIYVAARHNTDGVLVLPTGYYTGFTSRPATPGEYVQLYGTGFGPTNPAVPAGQKVTTAAPLTDLTQLQVTIGGAPATVQSASIVAPGEYQINVLVPTLADGDQLVQATIAGMKTQTRISIPVKN